MFAKSSERVRLGQQKSFTPIKEFLDKIAGKDDMGIAAWPNSIGGFQPRFLLGNDLLNFHAAYEDPEADNGPYLFAITKDGTVTWPVNKPFCELHKVLLENAGEIVFNDEIFDKMHVPDNAVICVGAVDFNYPDDRRKGIGVIVDSYYIVPTF